MQARFSHDRLIDGQPASTGHASAGKVLGRYITGCIQIGVELKPTLPALEPATGTTVVASDMPAAATCLRGMPGVNPGHRTTPFLGFVLNKTSKLAEAPAVHPTGSLGHTLNLCSLANIRQILYHNDRARGNRLDNLLAQYMIAVPMEASLPASQFTQMALRRWRPRLLQGTSQPKVALFGISPAVSPQKPVLAGSGGTGKP